MPLPWSSAHNERPPPAGDPPPYHPARMVRRYYGSSLRPVVLFCSALGFLFTLVSGIDSIQDSQDSGNTSRLNAAFLAFGIIYLLLMGVETYGFVVTWLASIPLVRIYSFLGTAAAVVTFGVEVARLTTHFMFKGDMVGACTVAETNASYVNITDNPFSNTDQVSSGNFTVQQAHEDCVDQWNRLTWEDIGWLILATLLAAFFSALITAYSHQLRDPSYLRSRDAQQAPSQRFQVAPWNRPPPGPPPTEDAPYVPPPTYPPPGPEPPRYDGPLDTPYAREKEMGGVTPTSAFPLAGADPPAPTTPWTAREDTADGLHREDGDEDAHERRGGAGVV